MIEAAASLLAGFLERERLVRELATLRAERAHDQRLAALGRVASSAAHDLNNVLTVIVGHADLLELELPGAAEHVPDSPAGEALEEIRSAAARGARLVEEVLAYGRKRPAGPATVDLALAPRPARRHAPPRRRWRDRARDRDRARAPARPPRSRALRADPRESRRQRPATPSSPLPAIPDGSSSGSIACARTTVRPLPIASACAFVTTAAGWTRRSSAASSSPSSPPAAPRGGTGLGLADVADFARDAGATIALASAPDAGCEIELRFPMADPTARIAPQAAAPRPLSSAPPSAFPTAR
jgi:two-component system cell cycle sensor histidine kinase/response regulator CckA